MTWPHAKLKFVARFGYGDAVPTDEVQEGQFRIFGSNGPYASFTRPNTRKPAIVVGRKGSYGKVNWTPEPCFASDTTFFIDSSTSRHDLRWIYWLLQTLRLDEGTDEAAVPGLNRETAYSKDVAVPPPRSQRAIADYLDRETARLDALVVAKERLLGLLAEKRRALITRAVTRGLDASAPLRDSGIPWLCEIPAHWETRRLRFASPQITVGIVVTPAKYYETSGVPCLRSLNVRETGLTNSDLVYISDESNVLLSKSRLHAGDLVAVRSGQPGTTAVVDRRFEGANCIDLIIIRRSPMFESAFLAHFLNSEPAKMQFLSGSGGAIQQHFNIETAADLVVPLPSLKEQRTIVHRIAVQCSRLDAITDATVRTTSLLRERRAALIAAAVTGQIDVQGNPTRV